MHDQMLFFCCFVKSRLWRPIINAFCLPTNGDTFGEHFVCRNFEFLPCLSPMKMIAMGFLLFFPGTSEPFKNRIKLSSFAAHVLVKFRAMPLDLSNRSKTILLRKKKNDSSDILTCCFKKTFEHEIASRQT